MPLLPILLGVASENVGVNLNDPASRSKLLVLINRAAKEVYESSDLVGCLREQVFYSDMTDNFQITLPYYIADLRGVRQWGEAYPLSIEQMTPKYNSFDWSSHLRNWRIKYVTPLETSLDVASHLTFTISSPMTEAVVINISGSTPTTDRITETVTIAIGALTATSSNLWSGFPGVKVIRKDIITTTNVEILNDAGVRVGVIANCELEARNSVVQVINPMYNCSGTCGDTSPCVTGVACRCWEVLYKIRFTPFDGDFDEFPCEGYDEAIQWKARELWWADQPGQETRSEMAFTKCKQIIESKAADARKGIVTKADFGKSKFSNLQWHDRSRMLPNRFNGGVYPTFPAVGYDMFGGGY